MPLLLRLQQLLLIPHAFAFADGRMREVLDAYCRQPRPGDDYLLLDEHDEVTGTLENVNARVVEAFDWLRLRGQARLIRTTQGDRIRLTSFAAVSPAVTTASGAS